MSIEINNKQNVFNEMVEEFLNIKIKNEITLSESQEKAFNLCKNGHNVFIIGSAGVGKSVLIKYLKDNLDEQNIYITATTGVSAFNIEGMTIHSFMGFGTGQGDLMYLMKKIKKNVEATFRIKTADVLVIDEISMLSAELFEKMDKICKIIRKSDLLFGGIQLVLTGDLLQLCPIFDKNAEDTRLLIESKLFNENFNKDNIIELTKNFRQENDNLYYKLLQNIRLNKHTEEDVTLLKNKISENKKVPKNIIKLVPLNAIANKINKEEFDKIKEDTKTYLPKNSNKIDNLTIKYEIDKQFKSKGLDKLTLKKGCRVMLVKNISVKDGLVNGRLGTVTKFMYNDPVVEFDNGQISVIEKYKWEFTDTVLNKTAVVTQYPLILAYAISIHKSQSITLDKAHVFLEKCFCDHQVYVALSRIKSLEGLYIDNFDENAIKINKKIIQFLEQIN